MQGSNGQTFCKFCDFEFKDPNKGALLRHIGTNKHKKAVESQKCKLTMDQFFKPKVDDAEKSLERATAKAELLMVGFMA